MSAKRSHAKNPEKQFGFMIHHIYDQISLRWHEIWGSHDGEDGNIVVGCDTVDSWVDIGTTYKFTQHHNPEHHHPRRHGTNKEDYMQEL